MQNKTVIKKIENCKPFVTSSILFVCVSIILTGIMIYFCLKSKNNNIINILFYFKDTLLKSSDQIICELS